MLDILNWNSGEVLRAHCERGRGSGVERGLNDLRHCLGLVTGIDTLYTISSLLRACNRDRHPLYNVITA